MISKTKIYQKIMKRGKDDTDKAENHNPALQKRGEEAKKTLKNEVDEKQPPFFGFGIFCALLAAMFSAINALFAKKIELPAMQITLLRLYMQFCMVLPVLYVKRQKVDILGPKELRTSLWIRGITGSTSLIFMYMAVEILTVGNAVTVTFLSIVMVPFFARVLLKETLTFLDVIFAVISIIGAVFIAQPTFLFPVAEGEVAPTNWLGIVYALISATLRAVSIVALRKVGKATYPLLNVLYYSVCGSLTTTIMISLIHKFEFPCVKDLPYVFSLGAIGVCGQCIFTLAAKYERAGTISVLKSTQIIFVYILQVTVLGDIPTLYSLLGAALILASSVGIAARKITNDCKNAKGT